MTALDFYEQEKKNIKVEASDDASITYKRLMVKFANMYHLEQLRLHDVSQQRKLLEWLSNDDCFNIYKEEISEILEDWQTYNSNCC